MVSKHPKKTIPKGTLKNIIKEMGVGVEEFIKL